MNLLIDEPTATKDERQVQPLRISQQAAHVYKLHLILKYLRKRRIAWVSLIAVTLCTAMVLVVISVMGGWLRMFRTSFHGLSGDIVVQVNSLTGFPYYQEMIGEVEKLPEVEAAARPSRLWADQHQQSQDHGRAGHRISDRTGLAK